MKRLLVVAAVLASGLALSAAAQTAATSAPAAASAPAGPPKVAVIEFQAAVTSTNEFQREFGDLQKKFQPRKQRQLGNLIDAQSMGKLG